MHLLRISFNDFLRLDNWKINLKRYDSYESVTNPIIIIFVQSDFPAQLETQKSIRKSLGVNVWIKDRLVLGCNEITT